MSSWLRFRGPRNIGLHIADPEEEQAVYQNGGESPERQSNTQPEKRNETFYPSLCDVLCVRNILEHLRFGGASQREGKGNDGPKDAAAARLPAELIDMIIDQAEYWPSIETSIDEPIVINQDEDAELLRTRGLCYAEPRILPHRTAHPCRKIVFTVTSHDQGWGGSGQDASPYSGSYTWFDAFIIPAFRPAAAEDNQQDTAALVHRYNEYYDVKHRPRFEAKEIFLPSENKLGSNKVAHREPQTRCITWHYLDEIDPESEQAKNVEASEGRGRATLDGRVVRGMEVGDQISVWARARFPGWANYVDHLGVRVFWAV